MAVDRKVTDDLPISTPTDRTTTKEVQDIGSPQPFRRQVCVLLHHKNRWLQAPKAYNDRSTDSQSACAFINYTNANMATVCTAMNKCDLDPTSLWVHTLVIDKKYRNCARAILPSFENIAQIQNSVSM